jgi:hypothetical protein
MGLEPWWCWGGEGTHCVGGLPGIDGYEAAVNEAVEVLDAEEEGGCVRRC